MSDSNDKDYITWNEINDLHLKVVLDIYRSKWKPDFIVGIVRGGAIPGIMISHTMNIPFLPLDVRLRDGVANNNKNWKNFLDNIDPLKRYLFVDDINDKGDTLNFILKKWNENFRTLFNDKNKICTLYERYNTQVESHFVGKIYYKDDWIVFPWENQYED